VKVHRPPFFPSWSGRESAAARTSDGVHPAANHSRSVEANASGEHPRRPAASACNRAAAACRWALVLGASHIGHRTAAARGLPPRAGSGEVAAVLAPEAVRAGAALAAGSSRPYSARRYVESPPGPWTTVPAATRCTRPHDVSRSIARVTVEGSHDPLPVPAAIAAANRSWPGDAIADDGWYAAASSSTTTRNVARRSRRAASSSTSCLACDRQVTTFPGGSVTSAPGYLRGS